MSTVVTIQLLWSQEVRLSGIKGGVGGGAENCTKVCQWAARFKSGMAGKCSGRWPTKIHLQPKTFHQGIRNPWTKSNKYIGEERDNVKINDSKVKVWGTYCTKKKTWNCHLLTWYANWLPLKHSEHIMHVTQHHDKQTDCLWNTERMKCIPPRAIMICHAFCHLPSWYADWLLLKHGEDKLPVIYVMNTNITRAAVRKNMILSLHCLDYTDLPSSLYFLPTVTTQYISMKQFSTTVTEHLVGL